MKQEGSPRTPHQQTRRRPTPIILSPPTCKHTNGASHPTPLDSSIEKLGEEKEKGDEKEEKPEYLMEDAIKELAEGLTLDLLKFIDSTHPADWKEKISVIRLLNSNGARDFTTDNVIEYVAKNFPNLHTLNLCGCVNITDTCFEYIRNLENLQALDLSDTLLDAGNDSTMLITHIGFQHLKGLPITTLNLSRTPSDEKTIRALSLGCPNLRTLSLGKCLGMSDVCHEYLRDLPLVELDLSECVKFQTTPNLPQLTKLNLSQCTGLKNASSLEECGNLEELSIDQCINMIDFSFLKQLTNLRILTLSNTKIKNLSFLQNLGELIELNLSNCNNIQVTKLSKLPRNLEILDLSGCNKITDKDLKKLLQRCNKLKKLFLEGVSEITAKGLADIAKNCPNITQLNLNGCSKVDHRALKQLKELTKLEKLTLPGGKISVTTK